MIDESPRSRIRTRFRRGVDLGARVAPYAIGLTPLALGGAIRPAHAVVVSVVSLFAIVAMIAKPPREVPRGTHVVLAVLTAFVVLPALQALPLPCEFVGFVSGRQRVEFVRAVADFVPGRFAPRCAITLDRGGTFAALGTAGAMLAAFSVGATTTAGGVGRRSIVAAIAFGATTISAVTFLHEVFSLDRVYGVYAPRFAHYAHVGPLLNANHLALCASSGFLASAYLLFVERRPPMRVLFALGAALDVAMTVATHSRGGLVTLALSATVLVVVVASRARTRAVATAVPITLGIVGLLACAGLVVALEWDAIVAEFEHAPIKTQLIVSALRASTHAGALGVGRGGFAAHFAPESTDLGRAMVAENLLAQWANEFGPVVALVAFVAIAVELVRAIRGGRAGSATILCAIAAAAMLHDLADFALELPALGAVFGLCLGAGLVRRPRRPASAESNGRPRIHRWFAATTAIAIVGSASGVLLARPSDLETTLGTARRDRARGRLESSDRTLTIAIADHAFEPVVYLELAANSAGRSDDRVVRWANFAMRRAPRWDSPHLVLADHFFRTERYPQAIAELASVGEGGHRRAAETACRYASLPIDAVRLARIVPERGDVVEMANVLRGCMPAERFLAIVEAAIESGRNDASLDRLAIETVFAARGADEAEVRFRVAETRHPRDVAILLAGARVAIGRREGSVALARATRARAIRGPTIDVETVRATAAALAGDAAELEAALRHLRREVDEGRLAHERLAAVEAESAELRGDLDGAFAARMRGYEATQSAAWLLSIEDLANRNGRTIRAADAIRRLCHDDASHPRCTQRP